MEFCPHGSRLSVEVDVPVTFIDPCATCERVLEETGFTIVPRDTVETSVSPAVRTPAYSIP